MSSINRFLERLGSDSPSPGGGSAAALTAALGAALVEMVARLNAKRLRKKGEASPAASAERTAAARALRRQMEALIAKDAAAFRRISRLSKKPGEGPRRQKALREGAAVPFKICEGVAAGLEHGSREKDRTGRWLSNDLAEAAILFLAAFHSAKLNVQANLQGITDKNFTAGMQARLRTLEQRTTALAQTIQNAQTAGGPS